MRNYFSKMSVFTNQRFSSSEDTEKNTIESSGFSPSDPRFAKSRAVPGSGKVRFCQVQWSRPGIFNSAFAAEKKPNSSVFFRKWFKSNPVPELFVAYT